MQEIEEDMNENADIDRLPFAEYAALMAKIGATKYGSPDTPKLSFEELVSSNMTFCEIEAEYGEETAINVGIGRDPDSPEWSNEDFARARKWMNDNPETVQKLRNTSFNWPAKEWTSIPIDYDLLDYFRAGGQDWHKRLNDTLRKAVFGPDSA